MLLPYRNIYLKIVLLKRDREKVYVMDISLYSS